MENDYGYEYKRFFSYFFPGELKEYVKASGFEVVFEDISTATNSTGWIQIIAKKNG
jgi:hypothetical protein